jgi:hypothetical protein
MCLFKTFGYQFLFKIIILYYLMNSSTPSFFIIGNNDYILKVLNKLPNKIQLFNNYFFNMVEPFIEYGINIYKNDDNIIQFKIIICPNDINVNINNYYKNILGLIICCDDTDYEKYNNIVKKINANENIYIWFNKETIDYNKNDIHYLFNDTNLLFINRIYNKVEMVYPIIDLSISNYCNII